MPERITSLSNARVKHVVRLRDAKERRRSSLTIIEGEREIARAVASGVEIEAFFISEGFQAKEARSIAAGLEKQRKGVYEVSEAVYAKIGYGDKREGVLCTASPKAVTVNDLPAKEDGLYVVIEHVEKPGNLGAILRSCDGAGVDAVFISEKVTDLYNPNTVRASLGAIFTLPVAGCSNEEALSFFKNNRITTIATSPDAKKFYYDEFPEGAVAFILGSEAAGLSPFWFENAQQKVRIPMKGTIDSLNVSASTAIILYEFLRQRSR